MRVLQTLFVLIALLGAVAGCGGDSSPTTEEAPVPAADGPIVRCPFALEKGDGVRLSLEAEIRVEAAGAMDRSQSMKVGTTLELRCTDVTSAEDRVARLRMQQFEVDGAPPPGGDPGLVGSMTIGSDRVVKTVELGGQTLPEKRPLANPFVTGGLSIYLPLAVGGMRVGESAALPPEMPANVLPPPIQHAVEQSADAPTFRGTYTLTGTREREGVLVGDFDVDVSLEFSGTVPLGPEEVEVLVDMSCKGTQSFVLSTGLPVGSGSSRVVQRFEMRTEAGENVMRTNADVRAECEPLAEEGE